MIRLARLDGEDYEVAFMKAMSHHHSKAVKSAQKCDGAAYHDQLVSMCQTIIETQLAEIQQMDTGSATGTTRCGGRPVHSA